jgi:hypothetical protein
MWAELMYVIRLAVAPQDIPPPPPPPPPIEKPKPSVASIRVGGQVQAALLGPGARWWNYLPREVIVQRQRAVESNPDDVCARGDLITHLWSDDRYEHLLWMIAHHPEWDGFYLPDRLFGSRIPDDQGARHDKLRQSWLQAVDREPRRAIVLYNAAMFFAIQEPERATALLTAAIQIEPGEPRFRRGLGMVFGLAQANPGEVRMRLRVDRFQPHVEFARYAQEQLQGSDDMNLLRGALEPFWNWEGRQMAPSGYRPSPFIKELGERPASVLRERNYLDVGGASESRYTQSSCEAPWPRRN